MKALILAAGYATRLYPLTKNFPKPLLEIEKNKPVINYILEKIEALKEIDLVYIITNNKYYHHFLTWKNSLITNLKSKIEIINDNTNSEQDKLGAIGDINFFLDKTELDEDFLIIAGDNFFNFSLKPMFDYFRKTNTTTLSLNYKEDLEEIKRGSCVLIDKNNRITYMEEKPQNPKSHLYCNCIYFWDKTTLPFLKIYLKETNNQDHPGRFIQWLYLKQEIHGFTHQGNMIDIGTKEALEKARKEFSTPTPTSTSTSFSS